MQTTKDASSPYTIQLVDLKDKERYDIVRQFRKALSKEGYDPSDDTVGDDTAEIYLCYYGSEPVMTFRASYTPNVGYMMARLAIPDEHQKGGHGSKLMPRIMLMLDSKVKPGEKICGKAKPSLLNFYAKVGLLPHGPEEHFRGVTARSLIFDKSAMQKL